MNNGSTIRNFIYNYIVQDSGTVIKKRKENYTKRNK